MRREISLLVMLTKKKRAGTPLSLLSWIFVPPCPLSCVFLQHLWALIVGVHGRDTGAGDDGG